MAYIALRSTLLNADEILTHVMMRQGMRVGDLGCGGHGQFSLNAARKVGSTGVVYVVDILKTVLAELAKKARLEGIANIKPIWSNLEIVGSTAIPAQSLDIALLINLLFQTRDRVSVLTEAKRLLKPGGQLLIVDWKPTATPLGPAVERRFTPPDCQRAAAGFILVEQFDAGRYHYGMVFIR